MAYPDGRTSVAWQLALHRHTRVNESTQYDVASQGSEPGPVRQGEPWGCALFIIVFYDAAHITYLHMT